MNAKQKLEENGIVMALLESDLLAAQTEIKRFSRFAIARPIDEWHEDKGPVLWWAFPIEEPPYCGTPLDLDWPDYHTHWTPIIIPEQLNA